MEHKYEERERLKSYFRKGCVPTEEQFARLIDSVPNLAEEGRVTAAPADGLRLFPAEERGVVASLYAREPGPEGETPLWRLHLGAEGSLSLCDGAGEAVLTADREKRVVIPGTLQAAHLLTGGERPEPETLRIEADGRWHDLPVESAAGREPEGCRVYRITACWRNRRSGRYALCEVLASHSGAERCRVQSPFRHWWGWSGRIAVDWQRLYGRLYLRIRSRGTTRGAEFLHCRIETLWEL